MTELSDLPSTATTAPKSLPARALATLMSPRAAYADIAARPRVAGALALAVVISAAAAFAFMSTDVGKQAWLDQVVQRSESFGRPMPDAAYERLTSIAQYVPYLSAGYLVVFFPVAALIVAGLLIAIFNAVMGGRATFKQVYAVVAHSLLIITVQQLFAYPLDYAKQSLSSPTNLTVFLPFLDEGSFLARLFGSIDLFALWWILNLAIGVAVLYKKRTTPIATTMLVVYVAIALVIAAVRTALSGA